MSEFVFTTNDADFEKDVLKSDKLVLVDFWAKWCQPCRAIAPLIDSFAEEYADQVRVYKVNIDESGDTPAKYGVMGIPSLLVFKDGNVVATHVGALTRSELLAFMKDHIEV